VLHSSLSSGVLSVIPQTRLVHPSFMIWTLSLTFCPFGCDQGTDVVWKFFPELKAVQDIEVMWKLFP
jgi:hypothetical protein